jgi:GxxExxY protein
MAAAFEVYNEIGYGMAEEIYQQSLEIELSLRKIPFLTKQELEGDLQWKRFILSDLHKKPVPSVAAAERPGDRNAKQR